MTSTKRKICIDWLLIVLIALGVSCLITISFSNKVYADTNRFDIVPVDDQGNEGDLCQAIQAQDYYLVKVPYGTQKIKLYDSDNQQYFISYNNYDDEIELYYRDCCQNNDGWWDIDLSLLNQSNYMVKEYYLWALDDWFTEDDYIPNANYHIFKAPDMRGFVILQVGDANSPLDCFAKITGEYYSGTTLSKDSPYTVSIYLGKDLQEVSSEQSIYYTLDESDPTTSSSAKKYDSPVSITNSCTLKAVARTTNGIYGKVSTYICDLKPAMPWAWPEEGSYFGEVDVELSTETDGAVIYYTIDGDEYYEYTEPIHLEEDTFLEAYAEKDGVWSEFLQQSYMLSKSIDIEFDESAPGVFSAKQTLNMDYHLARIITPFGSDKCKIKMSIQNNPYAEVTCNGEEIWPDDDEEDKYYMTLNSGATLDEYNLVHGVENTIVVSTDNFTETYTITCVSQYYNDLPDSVTDFWCIASQYTNNLVPSEDSDYGGVGVGAPVTLEGNLNRTPCASTGNFGGYIVWKYENGIKNDPMNPYGVDFIVFGNSFDGTNEAAEPGNILVSKNGTDWYTLAGSIHYDDNAVWNQEVTYTNSNGSAHYSFKDRASGTSRFAYPQEYYYPLHADLRPGDFTSFTAKGTLLIPESELNEYGNTLPPYPAFGYADTGLSEICTNEASNPYGGIIRDGDYGNRVTTNRNGDACDISWAVDENGNPVQLDEIHYIKVQTASFIDNGDIAEKSTEVCCMRVAKAADSAVGVTSAPAFIKIDGTEVQLKPGEVVDTTADGIFDIAVDAPETTNVYINSFRSHTAFMDKAPHGIVRVIVQEGEKEPLIYYFKIKQDPQQTSKKVTAVTFDTGKGLMQDKEKLTCYFDADTIEHLGVDGEVGFPKAVSPKESEGFAYWYSEDNEKQYTSYNADNATKLNGKTLTAVYGKADDVEAASAVAKAIEALPDADALTLEDDAEPVKAAQDAYDGLTGDQKKLVSAENKYKLALASATIGKLEAEASAADLQTQLDTVNGQLTAARNRVTELEGTVATLQGQLETAQQDVRDAQTRYDALKAESDADKAELAQAKADLEAAKAAEKKAKDELDEAKGELTTAQGKVTELEGKVSSLQQDLAAEQAKVEAAQNDADKYEKELATLKAKNAILKKTVKKVKVKAKGTKAVVSWKSVGKGFTYEVYRSTDPAKKFNKVKTIKKLKATVKKQKKGKTYYFKVRAFKKVGGKKVYTGYSNIAKVKIKK